jgi:hypothetical protein
MCCALAAKANPGLSAAKKEKNDAKRDNRLVASARRAAHANFARGWLSRGKSCSAAAAMCASLFRH